MKKEYTNVRLFYVTKHGERKGSELFKAYMAKRGKRITRGSYKTKQANTPQPAKPEIKVSVATETIIPAIPLRPVYRMFVTKQRRTNLVIKKRL
jgi:hypothetical protein